MDFLYANIPGVSNVLSVSVSTSHSAQQGTATVEAESTTLDIGSDISIDLGYDTNHQVIFTGYVKDITLKEPERFYVLTCSDVLIKAAENYVVATNPANVFKESNKDAALIIQDLMGFAGITAYSYDPSYFICAVSQPVEINFVTSYDYSKMLADLIAWGLWADINGTVQFHSRFPYVMGGDASIGTIQVPNIITLQYTTTDKDLRNKVVVWGSTGIYAEASAVSPYLPAGFYKTIAVSSNVINTQVAADLSCAYNLALYNKLTESIQMMCVGDPRYEARKVIDLNYPYFAGLNDTWYIYAVEQNWSKNGYLSTLELRR